MAGVLAIFSVLCFLGGLTTLLLPETMGLTLEEICGEESESSSADSMSTVDDSRPDYTQNQLMNDAQ